MHRILKPTLLYNDTLRRPVQVRRPLEHLVDRSLPRVYERIVALMLPCPATYCNVKGSV